MKTRQHEPTAAAAGRVAGGRGTAARPPPASGIGWLDGGGLCLQPALESEADRMAGRTASAPVLQRTGAQPLPPPLRGQLEGLSGIDLGGVQVHAGSPRPAQLGALAFAQGDQIHLAPGQERQLPHEAWHVVQQRQGRVPAGRDGAPAVQAKFSEKQIQRIAMLSMTRRIELLSKVRDDDLESWYDSPQFGSMFLGGEESDEIRSLRRELKDEAEMEALSGALQGLQIGDPMDELSDALARLSLNDPMAALPGVEIQRHRFDAAGDVRMHGIDGSVDVEMTDVHGQMDVEMSDVEGTVAMDIDEIDADVQMTIADIDGYVHVSLMDIDLAPPSDPLRSTPAPRGVLRIDIRGVHGVLELQLQHSDEPMDISIDGVAADEHVVRRVEKRKRGDEAPLPAEERRKRARRLPGEVAGGDDSGEVDALTESLAGLDLREPFYAEMDGRVHELYPADNLSDLIVHSDPVPLATLIAKKKWQGTALAGAVVTQLKALAATSLAALKAMSSPTKAKGETLRKAMKAIGKELAKVKAIALPKTALTGTNHPSNGGKTEGKWVQADPLTLNAHSGTIGHGPTADSRLMDAIRSMATPLGENKSYKMMHLLNHKVFGPGELWNMTPGPAASNSKMEKDIEEPLKRAIHDKGLVIGFEATVDYKADPMLQTQGELNRNPDGYRFKKIDFTAWEYELNMAGTAFDQVKAVPDADVATVNGGTVLWDYGGLTKLREKPKLLDSATTEQDLLDAELPAAVASKIWKFNQDVKAGKKVAFVVPKADKQNQLIEHIKSEYGDKRRISDKWYATAVNWS